MTEATDATTARTESSDTSDTSDTSETVEWRDAFDVPPKPDASAESDATDTAQTETVATTLTDVSSDPVGEPAATIPAAWDREEWLDGDGPHPFEDAIRARIGRFVAASRKSSSRRLHVAAVDCEGHDRHGETLDEDAPDTSCRQASDGYRVKDLGTMPPGWDRWCKECVRNLLPPRYHTGLDAAHDGDEDTIELLRADE